MKNLLLIFLLAFFAFDSYAQSPAVVKQEPGGIYCFDLKPDTKFGKDAGITTQVVTANYGFHPDFESVTWTCQGALCLSRSLIEFDLSGIPSTAYIDSAFLFLYANMNAPNCIVGQPTYGNGNAGYLRRITQNWNEQTVTWNTQPAYTTQDQVVIPQSTSTSEDYILDVRNLVQTSVQNPATSFGFIMMEQDEINYYNSLIFGSSDATDTHIHPKLRVCYTLTSTGISEINPSEVSIYPNPLVNGCTIADSNHEMKNLRIFNALGEEIFSRDERQGFSSVFIDATKMTPGVYFVKIITDGGSIVKLIIKN